MDVVLQKLDQLKELDDQREVIFIDKQTAIDSILTDEVKAKLSAIDAEFDPLIEAIDDTSVKLTAEIKSAVLKIGKTVTGAYKAVFSKGRTSWDTKALNGYAAAHSEIEQFKKVGNPSVSIRRK